MKNDLSKEEIVLFDDEIVPYIDNCVLSKNVKVADYESVQMERSGNVIHRPVPYIGRTYRGADQSANFLGYTQNTVPVTLGNRVVAPFTMNSEELRDKSQMRQIIQANAEQLASDINVDVLNAASSLGALVVASSTAATATSFGEISECDTIMNKVGVNASKRCIALSSGVANGLAKTVPELNSAPSMNAWKAYETSRVPIVNNFETFKLDYSNRIAAAGGASDTIDTRLAAGNYYVPKATQTAGTGERSNVDNRFQTITVSDTTGVLAGDALTIVGIELLHHKAKKSSGDLKPFRVNKVIDGTTLEITPPIISNQGGSSAEKERQNCEVTSTSATAAIVYLNTTAADICPFWHKDAIELIPGTLGTDPSAANETFSRTEQGIPIKMTKDHDIKTDTYFYRLDVLYDVAVLQPDMVGILLLGQ